MNLASDKAEKFRRKMEERQKRWAYYQRYHNPKLSRALTGIFLVAAGGLFLAKQLGAELPDFLFKWYTVLIALGFVFGAKHSFRNLFWLVPVAIGTVFLIDAMSPDINISRLFWPVFIIVIGLMILFKPKRWKHEHSMSEKWKSCYDPGNIEHKEDTIQVDSLFSGVERTVISKNFKGGAISCFMGGAEIDLSKADIDGTAVLDVRIIMGGASLVIPPNWHVVSEVSAIFGGIEDRSMRPQLETDSGKTLVLRGSVLMGGMEIKSF